MARLYSEDRVGGDAKAAAVSGVREPVRPFHAPHTVRDARAGRA
jgi:hypothetical protein